MKTIWIYFLVIAVLGIGFFGIRSYDLLAGIEKWVGIVAYLVLIHVPAFVWWESYLKKLFNK